ncbi:MAG: ABC transporter ATP-binding protein [Limnochordia bacterium]|nr:ABC transporter ATP-binding protein [Bacillota bacterium]NLL08558.1 ABC transporter ATP-binding protein [Bacillota bacterium]HBG09276.1 thiamine ABC transporter permease [Bacillota bacterium]
MKELKRFISYYRPERRLFLADLLAASIIAVLDLMFPIITRTYMKDFIPNRNLQAVLIWAGLLVVLYVLRLLCQYFVDYYGHVVGVNIEYRMRKDLFSHLQTLDFRFFDDTKVGHLMSRIVNDLRDITELAHHGPEDIFIATLMLIGSFVYLLSINVPLTLITFLFIPVIGAYAYRKRTDMNRAFSEERRKIADVNADLENSLSGIRVAQSFVNEDYEMRRFDSANSAFKKSRYHAFRAMAVYSSGLGFLTDLLNVAVLTCGALFMFKGFIDLADLTAYLLFIGYFLQPIRRLISFTQQYQQGMAGFRRFVELMEVAPSVTDKPGAKDLPSVQGSIELRNVSFQYDKDSEVLHDVSLSIPAGSTVAFVGPSGGGKTTLCHLIPRFYDVVEGAVLIDGHDVRDVTLSSLRQQIGFVQQDVFLFTGTIRENILYGNPSASEEEMVEAAKKAQIHEFVLSLKDGYDTYVGERGVKLSGGQKQRISIARVFLKNPPILILDEATSSLDTATELEIQEALEELAKDRTTLIIAHRLSTIRHADEIVVLTDGKIQERGTHAELVAKNGLYAKLHAAQTAQAV